MRLLNECESREYVEQFVRDGYSVHEGVLSAGEVEELRECLAALPPREEVRQKGHIYGVRNLLEICPAVATLAATPAIRQFASLVLGRGAFAARAIFFDKVPGANWSLFWHQDNVISVRERRDIPGFSGWARKTGVWQVQPPVEILAGMVTVRIHLDDCGPENGPLRVIPGSHAHGWLEMKLDEWKRRGPEIVCAVGSGGVVTMCPLTLHASSPSKLATHRRVIHIEYAGVDLPGGLEWNNRIGGP